MLNLLAFSLTGQAKITELQWQMWSGVEGERACLTAETASRTIDCSQNIEQFADLTCATLHQATNSQFPNNQCLRFNGLGGQWAVPCPTLPDPVTGATTTTGDIFEMEGSLHAMMLVCVEEEADDPLNDFTAVPSLSRMARSIAAHEPYLGMSGSAFTGDLGSSNVESPPSPAPAPTADNKMFEYVGIPIIAALALCVTCGTIYFSCGGVGGAKGEKWSNEGREEVKTPNDEPLQAPVDTDAPLDHDDERVQHFILSPHKVQHFMDQDDAPVTGGVVAVKVTAGAAGEESIMSKKTEEEAAPAKKKRSLRAMLFGRKKKTTESEDEGETEGATPTVGFEAKSHLIPVEEEDSPVIAPVAKKEDAEKQETSGGPTWGDEQPLILEATQCADARDSSAGYPVLEADSKPAEKNNNNLF